MIRIRTLEQTALACASLAVLTFSAHAQSMLSAHGTIIAATGDQAPGLPAGCVLNGSGTFDVGVLDDAGRVFFRSRLTGTSVLTTNERAYFVGSNRSNLALVLRAGDAVPTLAGGETLNTPTATGIGSTVRISSGGLMLWLSSFSGGASTSANDSAIFTGTPGNFAIAAREGGPQPGTTGATFPNLSALTLQGTQLSPTGRIAFTCATTGGDTTTANNAAWFGGVPNALELIMRKGYMTTAGNEVGTLGSQLFYNNANAALHEETFSLLPSAQLPASTTNDRVLFVYAEGPSPGTGTNTELIREGAMAAGTGSAVIGLTNVNTSPFTYGACPWNNNNKAFVACSLMPSVGDTINGLNDAILYVLELANPPVVVARKGDPAPGTVAGERLAGVSAAGMSINDNDRVAFQVSLGGPGVIAGNDSAVCFGAPGALQLVVREGDAAPGTTGAAVGELFAQDHFSLNDRDEIVFMANLIGGDVVGATNNRILYSWEPGSGLTSIVRAGDVIEVAPGVTKIVTSWSSLTSSNGDARALTFNPLGKMALRVSFTDGTAAIMSVTVPSKIGTAFCSGDGTATACPCGNTGATGRGCASSAFTTGAQLSAFGVASATPQDDSLTLTATNVTGPALFFQGSSTVNGGSGVAFGDGLMCLGGGIVPLGVVFPTAGTVAYPGGSAPVPIHVGGSTTAGDVRHYQCWYRDAASHCSPATYNLSQAITLTWTP
jgi:hypothetical protein